MFFKLVINYPLTTSLNGIVAAPEFRFLNCASGVRCPFHSLRSPSFASGSQKIEDFLGVALQVQQREVLFASLKRTHLMFVISLRSSGLISVLHQLDQKII
jgi:hypothetical protein